MFDPSSRALLRQAPDLPGLDPEALDELLTAAHIELSSDRGGDGVEPHPEPFGFPFPGGGAGESEHLHPRDEVAGQREDRAPDLVLGEVV